MISIRVEAHTNLLVPQSVSVNQSPSHPARANMHTLLPVLSGVMNRIYTVLTAYMPLWWNAKCCLIICLCSVIGETITFLLCTLPWSVIVGDCVFRPDYQQTVRLNQVMSQAITASVLSDEQTVLSLREVDDHGIQNARSCYNSVFQYSQCSNGSGLCQCACSVLLMLPGCCHYQCFLQCSTICSCVVAACLTALSNHTYT